MTDAWGQNPGDDAPDSADEDGAADEDPYAGEGGDSESPESAVPAAGPSAAPENTGPDPSQMDTLVQDIDGMAITTASWDGMTFNISDEEDELATAEIQTLHYEASQDEKPSPAPEIKFQGSEEAPDLGLAGEPEPDANEADSPEEAPDTAASERITNEVDEEFPASDVESVSKYQGAPSRIEQAKGMADKDGRGEEAVAGAAAPEAAVGAVATKDAKKKKTSLSYDHYVGIAKKSAVEYLICNDIETEVSS
eukprot:s657_g5.t1